MMPIVAPDERSLVRRSRPALPSTPSFSILGERMAGEPRARSRSRGSVPRVERSRVEEEPFAPPVEREESLRFMRDGRLLAGWIEVAKSCRDYRCQ